MKQKENYLTPALFMMLLMILRGVIGCFPDRLVTDPDFEANEVRRPTIIYTSPVNGATEIATTTTISVWFDESMNETSVRENMKLWPAVTIDSLHVIAVDPKDPQIVYVAKSGTGIFKTEDGAELWNWHTPSAMQMEMINLVVAPQNSNLIYVATADSGVYKSQDGGATWQPLNANLPETIIRAMAVDPSHENILYVATGAHGIFKSEDAGETWSAKNTGLRITRKPNDIAINPRNGNTLYLATKGDFIMKSVNGGETWKRLRSGFFTFNFNRVTMNPRDTSTVYAVSDGGGIYRTENSGENWQLIVEGLSSLDINDVCLHAQNPSQLLLSTSVGLFRSDDAGDNWYPTGDIPPEVQVFRLEVNPQHSDRVYAATSAGVYASDDFGISWQKKNNLSLDELYVQGDFKFSTWKDTTMVVAPINATAMDTSYIVPYVLNRALAAWIANGRIGSPPVEAYPSATKVVFTPSRVLLPGRKYQVQIAGTFLKDKETLKATPGARDIHGNSLETDYNFSFSTTAK